MLIDLEPLCLGAAPTWFRVEAVMMAWVLKNEAEKLAIPLIPCLIRVELSADIAEGKIIVVIIIISSSSSSRILKLHASRIADHDGQSDNRSCKLSSAFP